MNSRPLRIFLSSTYSDLRTYRPALEGLISEYGELFVGMEHFGSRAQPSLEVCLQEVERCDLVVVLVGSRYGTEIQGRSFTEHEVARALQCGIPTLVFVQANPQPAAAEEEERRESFLGWLGERYTWAKFDSELSLVIAVAAGIRRVELAGAEGHSGLQLVNDVESWHRFVAECMNEFAEWLFQLHGDRGKVANYYLLDLGKPYGRTALMLFEALLLDRQWSRFTTRPTVGETMLLPSRWLQGDPIDEDLLVSSAVGVHARPFLLRLEATQRGRTIIERWENWTSAACSCDAGARINPPQYDFASGESFNTGMDREHLNPGCVLFQLDYLANSFLYSAESGRLSDEFRYAQPLRDASYFGEVAAIVSDDRDARHRT